MPVEILAGTACGFSCIPENACGMMARYVNTVGRDEVEFSRFHYMEGFGLLACKVCAIFAGDCQIEPVRRRGVPELHIKARGVVFIHPV